MNQRLLPPLPDERHFFARRGKNYVYNFFRFRGRKILEEFCGIPDPVMVKVRERSESDPISDYWGWEKSGKQGVFSPIQPSLGMLEMCFPYGLKSAEKSGQGRRVNLVVEIVDENP